MSPFIAELLGTMVLILLGNGVVANVLLNKTAGNDSGWIVITAGWGMAVFVGIVIAGDASGAHLNPAVTVGLAAAGKFAWEMAPNYILAQCLGAAIGAALVWATYRKHYAITEDSGAKLGTFATAPAIPSTVDNFIAELIGTFVLVFTVFCVASPEISGANLEGAKIGLGAIGALPVGLLVFGIGLSLGGPTGYAINPARDLMPRIMHAILPIPGKGDNNWGYAWIPVVGPIVGGLVAAGLFMAIQ